MHIKNPQSALLTNHEVLLHLVTEDAEYNGTDATNRKRKKPSGLNHMLRDGLAYLQTPDYTTPALVEMHPNRPMTLYKGPNSLFRALAPKYRLNKAEYLQIYNLRPTTQVMLELVIEEAGTRFTEDELHDILAIIQHVFDEEEASIPAGVEYMEMPKIANKLLGANKKRRKVKRKV
ncbi:rna polymerase iii subunit c17 protein [Stemphylium lycopersici]|uniref:DNA-directed RNA polymerase III subunit RPC9 n=1 Tax=Stemphylium lycopersici TaxID=183478 RepID=A0A364N191_STELY|nr:rna polymerase iii subunit c17 protein [Stemphylium lycopersici]RAR05503.1 rna polymerase iii subunit c17 protein [Stemphylium lycopersici]RAR09164.1 rna polymerase iii subunit c17 protein [Stemphylium lycopersici]